MTQRRRFAVLVSAALAATLSTPAWSVGTVAIGLPANVAEGGFAMGITYNYGNRGDADAEALKQNFMDAPDSTRALCRIDSHFENQCFAMAMDPEPGTYGIGYKAAATQSQADAAAMTDCQNTSAYDRKSYCKVSYRTCDGTAR